MRERTMEHRRKLSEALMGRETKPAIERFMSKVKKDEKGCWNWTGTVKPGGYGVFSIKKNNVQKTYNAHRWAYTYFIGEIPEGLTIDHLCRNRRCVNPKHLEPVTIRENLMRGRGYSGVNNRKTHCPKGHPLVAIPKHIKSLTAKRYCPICYIQKPLEWNRSHKERKNENNRKSYANTKAKNSPKGERGGNNE